MHLQPMDPDLVRPGRPMPLEEIVGTPYKRRFLGGFLTKLKDKAMDTYDSFFNKQHVPKRFRNFLKAHGNEKITSITVYRAPLDRVANTLLQVVSFGQWDKIMQAGGHDTMFHLGIIINGKYTMEKLDKLEAREDTDVLKNPELTTYPVDIHKNSTINEMVSACAKLMGSHFTDYDAFKNNCQDFVISLLKSVGLLTQGASSFIKQNLKKLIEATPSYMGYVAKGLTDTARGVGNVYEAIVHKRGGQALVRGGQSFKPF